MIKCLKNSPVCLQGKSAGGTEDIHGCEQNGAPVSNKNGHCYQASLVSDATVYLAPGAEQYFNCIFALGTLKLINWE